MPAARDSSEAVSARPSIRACNMLARAGSPAREATSANLAWLGMAGPFAVRPTYPSAPLDASAATVALPGPERQGRGRSLEEAAMGAAARSARFYGWRV